MAQEETNTVGDDGDDGGYSAFMRWLWETQVDHDALADPDELHLRGGFSYHLDWLARASRLARAVQLLSPEMRRGKEVSPLQPNYVAAVLSTLNRAIARTNRLLDEAGVLDVIDSYYDAIISGLRVEHLPQGEGEVLRRFGFAETADHLDGLIYAVKANASTRERGTRRSALSEERGTPRSALTEARQLVEQEHARLVGSEEEPADDDNRPRPRKRRWFKGLGQVSQGTALVVADIAMATGVSLPVTADWGALVSISAGVGTVMGGLGDLRSE